MSALVAIVALPAAAAVIWLTLHTPLARRLVAEPSTDRWHDRPTPLVGGFGIAAGLLAGAAAALAAGAVEGSSELWGVLGGCAILFAAGALDDARPLGPLAKLGAQVAAAAVVMLGGLTVEIVDNELLALLIGLAWYVGMANAFNLLDNIDGLAGTLALVAATYFALDAAFVHDNPTVLVLALALAAAAAGFLPFNLRRPRPVFMGDSGSQILGFALAALGLASTWTVAGSTLATILVPFIVLGVPIVDTGFVAVTRWRAGRPIHRGGRDHASHRLVHRGLSELRVVALLGGIGVLLGATSLAYGLLDNAEVTLVGVVLTFALLVQYVSYLAEVERSPASADVLVRRPLPHRVLVSPRRLLEVLVDFALVSAAFLTAYVAVVGSAGTPFERHIVVLTLPTLLVARYLAFLLFGLYKRVWRYAGMRDALAIAAAVAVSELAALTPTLALDEIDSLPLVIFVLDALLCTLLIGISRSAERGLDALVAALRERHHVRRVLIVGAGRSGRSLLRELRETPGHAVVGFLDDDPELRGRRLQGAVVLGRLDEADGVLAATRPDAVLITIPGAPRETLADVIAACAEADVACRFVRRHSDLAPEAVLGAAAE